MFYMVNSEALNSPSIPTTGPSVVQSICTQICTEEKYRQSFSSILSYPRISSSFSVKVLLFH